MEKVINTSSIVPLVDVIQHDKLNRHMQMKNAEGWELMSVQQELTGIQELLILFWKKTVEETPHGG